MRDDDVRSACFAALDVLQAKWGADVPYAALSVGFNFRGRRVPFLNRAYGIYRAADAQRVLREAPGVMLVDKREDGGYVTPVESVGEFATYVSRVREDPTVENGLSLWCVSDNLRKGAALNAVQIAELLGRKHLQKGG